MDFTREPIIETVITPKEGCKLVVRSSKGTGQEEYFVDAVEVVSFGHSFFFRSLERPKTFFVPATDYEILEVRETRMVLKNVGIDRTIKIGGGREAQMRTSREQPIEKEEVAINPSELVEVSTESAEEKPQEVRLDKKRERRRNYRRRRGRDAGTEEEKSEQGESIKNETSEVRVVEEENASPLAQQVATTSILTSLLPSPSMLVSDTIAKYYKGNKLFEGAFYSKTDPKNVILPEEAPAPEVAITQPEYGSYEMSEQELEEIYNQRKKQTKNAEEDLSTESMKEISPMEETEGEPKEELST